MPSDSGILLLAVLAAGVSIALLAYGLLRVLTASRSGIEQRMASLAARGPTYFGVEGGRVAVGRAAGSELGGQDEGGIDRALRNWTMLDRMALDLVQAHLRLRLHEYLAIRGAAAALTGVGAFFLSGTWIVGVIAAAIGFYAPRFYIRRRAQRRLQQFSEQLVDTLNTMSMGMKSGSALQQVFNDIAEQMPAPMSEEFSQVVRELSLGEGLEAALMHLQTRIRSYDLDLIVTAMIIQRRLGGNLGETLDNIAHTIRERIRIWGEIRSLTAEVRLSAIILASLPFVTGFLISLVRPDYLTPLFTTVPGLISLAVAGVLLLAAVLMIRRMADIEV